MTLQRQRLVTVLMVLYITFVGGTAFAHAGALPDTLRVLIIVGPAAAWLVWLIRQRRPLPHTLLDVPLAVYVIWQFISAFFAIDRRISLEMIWPLLAAVLGFYLLVDLMRRGWAHHFAIALLFVALTVVIVSSIELSMWYFGWIDEAGWFPVGGLSHPIPPKIPHLQAALNVSTIEGNYVAMLIPLVIAWLLAARRRSVRIGLGALALALLLVELLTFSRGGLLGVLVGVLLLFVFGVLRWQRRTGRMATLFQPRIILGATLIAAIGVGLLVVVWTTGASRGDSDQGRIDTWRSTVEITRDHPTTGVGPGLFGLALRSYRAPEMAQDQLVSAHNVILNTLADTGIPGLLILIWVTAIFGRMWWLAWRSASPTRRIWLEGGLAAIAAYSAHSMVDTFPLMSSILPLVVIGAYTAAEPQPAASPSTESSVTWGDFVPLIALLLVVFYGAWIVRMDIAQGFMTLSRIAITDGDLDTALQQAERARAWDPDLSLYQLHEGYVLGMLANQDPGDYLDRAIRVQESAMVKRPTFDLGWANLAGLFAQNGDLEAASHAMTYAADIHPANAIYWFELGDYAHALKDNNDLAWTIAQVSPEGLNAFCTDDTISPARRLYVAVLADDEPLATLLAPQAQEAGGWLAHLALGMYERRIVGDDDAALVWLTQAIDERSVDERADLERAEIYLARGELDAAEKDARTALFVDEYGGAPGNYVLARIAQRRGTDDATIERLLKASVSPRPKSQYFAGTVYGRPAAFDYLPQLDVPRMPRHLLDGWFALAEFYLERDRVDDARQVYRDLLHENPYLTAAQDALESLTPIDSQP